MSERFLRAICFAEMVGLVRAYAYRSLRSGSVAIVIYDRASLVRLVGAQIAGSTHVDAVTRPRRGDWGIFFQDLPLISKVSLNHAPVRKIEFMQLTLLYEERRRCI